MAKKTTHLKEIAYELGLSINTVSRALRDCYDISSSTKEKVRQKAIELGYMPNNLSSYIKHSSNKLIAIIINSFENPYINHISELLINECFHKKKYGTTIIYDTQNNLNEDIAKQCIYQRVDVVVTFVEPTRSFVESCKLYEIPVIFLNDSTQNDDICKIRIDNKLGALVVSNYMLNIHGKKDKYIFLSLNHVYDSRERYKFIKQNLQKASKNNDIDFKYINLPDLDSQKAAQLISNGYYNIFCFNDETAYKFLYLLSKTIPNPRRVLPNLHIIGFDAVSTQINGYQDLTSVSFSYNEIISNTMRLIEILLKDKKYTETVTIPVHLHVRVIS